MKSPVQSSAPSPVARGSAAASSARSPRAPQRPSPYLSGAQTKALFANSLAARMERLSAEDMVSTDEAAALAGTSRVTINAWIAKGRAIGLTQTRRGFRLPRWQFEPQCWAALPALSQALGTVEGWALLAFLETPLGGLSGKTPRQAIEQGQLERVLALAGVEAS
ncbi:hypothetical protein HNP55_001815 [Paucibacter oligotrophus]|uniref:Uncharacterized protein n=1 Tax=Roseateles oligotrophus TaxID=1769250 RepID=A0A840L5K0_9BURK|nr:hypothetical protein [Roseateles oligotrophus]MBB4843296.1 hypothetical protein [Roseateles oligotrophus]